MKRLSSRSRAGREKAARLLRRVARFIFASVFWLNALTIFRPGIGVLALRLNIEPASALIILILVALSFCSLYGLWNFAVDCLYIWTFPFILAWIVGKYIFRFLRFAQRCIHHVLPSPEESMTIRETLPIFRSMAPELKWGRDHKNKAEVVEALTAAEEPTTLRFSVTLFLKSAYRIASRVLLRSALLCGLLVFVASEKPLILAGLSLTVLGLINANVIFARRAFRAKKINAEIHANVAAWIKRVAAACRDQYRQNPENIKAHPAASLVFYKFVLNLISKTTEASEALVVIGLCTFVFSYLWAATVFYFVYLGIAKLSLPAAQWPHWWESVFFSIFSGNLAKNDLLTIVVIMQAIELWGLVYILWRFMAAEIDTFRKEMLEHEAIVDHEIAIIEAELAQRESGVTSE
jgi:hypothetical protein